MAKKTEKTVKAKKAKTVPAKKLPGLLKKAYTPEQFEKKIISKIYIETDKKLIESLFSAGKDKKGNKVFQIDRTASLPKSDFNRAKFVAKNISQQKASFKLVPFIAAVSFVCILSLFVALFKNVAVKKLLVTSMQNIFLAKTDIGNVDFKILGASLQIDSLAQADKDAPMKNLFEIDSIHLDLNLPDLLRGKFHAETMEVTGVALGTERKVSGELVFAPQSKEVKKAEKVSAQKSGDFAGNAAKSLEAMFSSYDPENMLSGIQNDLKSPKVAESISADVTAKVAKWKNVPAEYQKTIEKITADVNEIAGTDWSKFNDPVKIKNALEKISSIYKEAEAVKSKIKETSDGIASDAAAVNGYSKQMQSAIKSDSALVDSKISEMKKSFSPAGLKGVMNDALQSVLYSVAGKYYPYANMAVNAAMNSKGSGKSSAKAKDTGKEKKEKKASSKKVRVFRSRSAGRDVYYRKDVVPRLLIEKVKASGYEYKTSALLFEGTAEEISSDQNMRGKPATVKASFNVAGGKSRVSAVVDARENSDAKLIQASYSGKGFPIEADAEVFKLDSDSVINAKMTCDPDGSFSIGGTLDLKIKDISGMEFSPEKVSALYGKALKGIKILSLGFVISSDSNGLSVQLTDFDKAAAQIASPVSKALSSELNAIADDARKQVSALLAEKNSGVTASIKEFGDIQSSLSKELASANNLEKVLDQKKKDLMAKSGAGSAQDAANKLLNKLF